MKRAGLRIVAAAYRLGDGTICVGVRHGDAIMRGQALAMGYTDGTIQDEKSVGYAFLQSQYSDGDGFIANNGEFYNRKAAYEIAKKAGQIRPRGVGEYNGDELFSEDLY